MPSRPSPGAGEIPDLVVHTGAERGQEITPATSYFTAAAMAAAKRELRSHNPCYVSLIEEIAAVHRVGLEHPRWDPERLPECGVPLSKPWTDLLEAVWTLNHQVALVLTTLSALTAVDAERDSVAAGPLIDYHVLNWNVWIQSFVEKAQVCIKLAVRRSGLSRESKGTAIERHTEELRELQEHFEKSRDPAVHGGPRTVASGITEEIGWEAGVAIPISPAESLE